MGLDGRIMAGLCSIDAIHPFIVVFAAFKDFVKCYGVPEPKKKEDIMRSALSETYFCDISHPALRACAASLVKKLDTAEKDDPRAVARACFSFVRDRIFTGYDLYETRASEILEKGYGICWGKSLLLMALLRCCGIEAVFGTVAVHRSFVAPLIGAWHWLANSPYHHCLVHARLGKGWTVLDPVLDPLTYETFFVPAGVAWGIDWDGRSHCILYRDKLMGDPVPHEDIDAAIRDKAGNRELPPMVTRRVNDYFNTRIWKKTGQRPSGYRPGADGSAPAYI